MNQDYLAKWCPRWESNPHGFTRRFLRPLRLPFRHSGEGEAATSLSYRIVWHLSRAEWGVSLLKPCIRPRDAFKGSEGPSARAHTTGRHVPKRCQNNSPAIEKSDVYGVRHAKRVDRGAAGYEQDVAPQLLRRRLEQAAHPIAEPHGATASHGNPRGQPNPHRLSLCTGTCPCKHTRPRVQRLLARTSSPRAFSARIHHEQPTPFSPSPPFGATVPASFCEAP